MRELYNLILNCKCKLNIFLTLCQMLGCLSKHPLQMDVSELFSRPFFIFCFTRDSHKIRDRHECVQHNSLKSTVSRQDSTNPDYGV